MLFRSPRFAPDFQKIAQMKLENLAPTLANPGELTSILGAILGGKKKTEGGAQQPEKQPGLADILGTLGGKKKPEQNPPAGGQQPEPGASSAPAQPPAGQQQPANPLEQILTDVLKPKQKKKEPPPPPPPQPQQEEEKPPDQPK